MSIFSKMTAIANKIRSLTGDTEPLTLDDMSNNLGEVNSEVSEQVDLIAQIMTALEGKAVGNPDAVELNFDIKRYSSEEELLADAPAENTIGVVTTTLITGYKFSATEPELMNEGEVWIYVGTNSDVAFDIVNDVTIYPISAKQYVSGAWVDKTAKIYQNGKWNELDSSWFYNGVWRGERLQLLGNGGSFTEDNTGILLKTTYQDGAHAYLGVYTDLTNVDTIYTSFDYFVGKAGEWVAPRVGIFVTSTATPVVAAGWDGTGTVAHTLTYTPFDTETTLELKVKEKNITGFKYVWFSIYGAGNVLAEARVTKFWSK